MSFFGIEAAANDDDDREEAPHSLRHVFDITAARGDADRAGALGPRQLDVTFSPLGIEDEAASALDAAAGADRARQRVHAVVGWQRSRLPAPRGAAHGGGRSGRGSRSPSRRGRRCSQARVMRTASARGRVMVVAMMLPAAIPLARAISFDSVWDRRYRSAALFLAALPRRVGRVRRRRARRLELAALLGAGHALHGARRDRRDPARRRELAARADAPPLPEALPPPYGARRARPSSRPRLRALRSLPRPLVRRRVLAADARDDPRSRARAHGRADGAVELAAPRPPPATVATARARSSRSRRS